MKITILFCWFLLLSHLSNAQYPRYFSYDNERGLPANEVYSIVQDNKGFIWLGCGAGLIKYDGIRYISYQSPEQKSRSVTGLTISSSGTLYCYNFKSQIFYLKGDSLTELPDPGLEDIINMTADTKGNLFVSHLDGISSYNEKEKIWTLIYQPQKTSPYDKNRPVCKASRITDKDELYFICTEGIGQGSTKGTLLNKQPLLNTISPRKLDLVEYRDTLWIFGKESNQIYHYHNGTLSSIPSQKLQSILHNRKINIARVLQDNKLWICTYKGIICYDAAKDSVNLFYPEIAFSDCISDREGNYWFSTLQEGVLRVPNLHYIVWNKDYGLLANDRLSKIANDNKHVYFTTATGIIGQVNTYTYELKTYNTGLNADIQSFDYDSKDRTLWFNQNNHMFSLNNAILNSTINEVQAVKARYKVDDDVFLASSHGTFLNNQLINNYWAREILHTPPSQTIWIASNNGLLRFRKNEKHWKLHDTLLVGRQILTLTQDTINQQVYALTFDGHIYQITSDNTINAINILPKGILPVKIKFYDHCLYLATNHGVWILNLHSLSWQKINRLAGIASDNIQDIAIVHKTLWLSTGKGLQKIPLSFTNDNAEARLYIKKISINDSSTSDASGIILNYGQALMLYPEAALYNCQEEFQYLYRIRNIDSTWASLPSNIERIELQNIPSGNFEIEVKVTDCLGRDSNTLVIDGYVNPPFWRTWWFILSEVVCISLGAILYLRHKIRQLKEKQLKEIAQLNIENELRVAQQRALIAQMNPHFIFNVLNSIKSYIYKNDKEKALNYLDDFSNLVRTVLEMSNIQYTTLDTELKILKLYIELEAMMLADEFHYQIEIDHSLEINQLKFPALILQPFIENSFKHGLRSKKGKKCLYISANSIAEDIVQIALTDNGIGRKKAEENNHENIFKRVSFATNAIKHRIELINKEGLLHMNVETIDMYDNESKSIGTKIIITTSYK
ncbi:MAG TPA: histidine kinase [Cytophagaceae bacterium]